MRLDKFLKQTRLVKRRTVADTLCSNGFVTVNGRVAKSSTMVGVGDALVLQFGNRTVRVTVLALPPQALANQQQASAFVSVEEELTAPPDDE